MTRKQIVNLLDAVFSKGLYCAVIIYRSPLTKVLGERHIYADAHAECITWLHDRQKFYVDHDIPFLSYLNNRIEQDYKFEITEEDCKDE